MVFDLGTLAAGGNVNLTVEIMATTAGLITNSARITAAGLDSASPNYLSSQSALVVNGSALPTTVFTTNDSGAGSLRKAIQAANKQADPDTITFNIPGPGVHTIRPITGLPFITAPVTIDGYTQPGAQSNSLVQGDNRVLLIELDGSQAAGNSPSGLLFLNGSGGSVVRGLVINRFSGGGVSLLANTLGSRIEGNFIGTDASGMTAAPNGSAGINLNDVRSPFSPTEETIIGGLSPDKRNVISGNNNVGVFVFGSAPNLVRIKGNYIGTDKTGMAPLPNLGGGVSISAPDVVVGGIESGAPNIIAFNAQTGVTLGTRADGVPILHNSIFSNNALGISGSFAGPQLTGATPGASTVTGFFEGNPYESCVVEVFANVACDPTGFGEGQMYLGTATFNTDASGHAEFNVPVSPALVPGRFISATVTDGNKDTSMFSHCLQVGPANDLSIAQTVSTNPLLAGSNVVFTITVSNTGPAIATGVFLSWEMPNNFTYITGSNGVQHASGHVSASAGSLTAGAATNWHIVVRPKQTGTALSTFVVVGDQPDDIPANNVSSTAYNIINPAPRTLLVVNTNAFGDGSLYQAISDANTGPGGDTIAFNIPGAGVHTISTTFLPSLTVPVTIDGSGSHPNSLLAGNNETMLIELSRVGLQLYGGYSTVRGLVINNASIGIYFGDPDNIIPARNNVVEGCFLGVNPEGTLAKPNTNYGIAISGSRGDRIGGTSPAQRNLISGTGYAGIGLLDQTRDTVVQGNYIGTDASGTNHLGNKAVGIYSEAGAGAGILIGGSGATEGNLIAFNDGPGVLVYIGTGNTISGNSIFGDGGIGINLGGQGSVNDAPRPNDLGDMDAGENDFLNSPVITQVISNASSTRVQGILNSLANRSYRLEFFSSPANPDAFYLSEGKNYLGATSVTTDSSGNAAFDVTFPVASQYVSATTTDPDGNTSPFSTFGYQTPAACFQPGDLLTGYPDGTVQWRRADGRPVRVFQLPDEEATGLAFNNTGQLYVTGIAHGQIHRFDNCGNALAPLLTGDGSDPESMLFDSAGNYFVGFVNPTQNVRKFDAAGNLLSQFSVPIEKGGADWFDISADGQTLYYTPRARCSNASTS